MHNTAPVFCCSQRQQLCEALVRQTCLFEGKQRFLVKSVSLDKDTATAEVKKLIFQGRKSYNQKCFVDIAGGFGLQSEGKIHKGRTVQLPAAETCGPTTFRSFRLSCSSENGFWTVCPVRKNERSSTVKVKEAQALVPVGGHETFQFGICHRQNRTDFVQKYYSSGVRFLTVFPDGSAQCLYPSGLLALIVVVTEGNGGVCILYDDSDVPKRSIRAVFQSDGRATCYHSSGNIWLSLTKTGGQCLDEAGARVRQWTWSSLTHTPLRPVFLSLNRTLGVRVLGPKQVFVTFLAQGKQAKFSVGACCDQIEDDAQRPVSQTKEELFVLATRMKIHMTIQNLHQLLKTPSCPKLPKEPH
ncbi:glutamate-rich protein 6 [Cynoglossus semilaevis]|uniref:glutamate-rich protein 6 n=1 Tax=Cynoglossus semilaevis TaxID=244447 RepID=UPI000D631599|nr:glutamate-rich protein 6-like [Cynoglossus semilaevis]